MILIFVTTIFVEQIWLLHPSLPIVSLTTSLSSLRESHIKYLSSHKVPVSIYVVVIKLSEFSLSDDKEVVKELLRKLSSLHISIFKCQFTKSVLLKIKEHFLRSHHFFCLCEMPREGNIFCRYLLTVVLV